MEVLQVQRENLLLLQVDNARGDVIAVHLVRTRREHPCIVLHGSVGLESRHGSLRYPARVGCGSLDHYSLEAMGLVSSLIHHSRTPRNYGLHHLLCRANRDSFESRGDSLCTNQRRRHDIPPDMQHQKLATAGTIPERRRTRLSIPIRFCSKLVSRLRMATKSMLNRPVLPAIFGENRRTSKSKEPREEEMRFRKVGRFRRIRTK